MAVMSEAEKVSELHLEVKTSLMNEDFEKIKNWQKEAFHKQMMGGFKETKEAEDGFRKAQKPWAKKLKEVPPSLFWPCCASLHCQGSLLHFQELTLATGEHSWWRTGYLWAKTLPYVLSLNLIHTSSSYTTDRTRTSHY